MARTTWIAMGLAWLLMAGCKQEPPPKARPTPSRKDLHKLGLALRSYHDTQSSVPPLKARAPADTPDEPAPKAPTTTPRVPTKAVAPKPAKKPARKAEPDEDAVYKKRSKRAQRHPLAKARRSQYVLYRVGDMMQRKTVVTVTPTRVGVRIQTIRGGRDLSDVTTETDLEAALAGAGAEVTYVGKRVVSVSGRRLVCEVTERKRLDGSITRTWRSPDVPLEGIVRVQRIRNGKTTVVRELVDFGDFWGPDHSR